MLPQTTYFEVPISLMADLISLMADTKQCAVVDSNSGSRQRIVTSFLVDSNKNERAWRGDVAFPHFFQKSAEARLEINKLKLRFVKHCQRSAFQPRPETCRHEEPVFLGHHRPLHRRPLEQRLGSS